MDLDMAAYRSDGPPHKRVKSEQRGLDYHDPTSDRHNTAPSRVLHVRGLRDYATQNDIVDAVKQFGRVAFVMMLPRHRQALVEFETLEDAKAVVSYAESNPIYVCGQAAFFNFSTSDSIKRPPGAEMADQENKIVLFTILNPKYPITVDVMHTICSPHGDVLRIVIFKKHGLQAMVEFDSVESSRKAKQALNGCDVYSGCCTLKIEYAKAQVTRLNVFKNDKESWDYTNPNPGGGQQQQNAAPARSALLGDGPGGYSDGAASGWDDVTQNNSYTEPAFFNDPGQGFGGMGGDDRPYNGPFNGRQGGGSDTRRSFDEGQGGDFGGRGASNGRGGRGGMGGGPRFGGRGRGGPMGGPMGLMQGPGFGMGGPGMGSGPQPGCVLLVYGLKPGEFNCDKVFNLFCIYGNVLKIKFLRTKEGSAMIQMSDHGACERAVMNLNHSYFFDSKLSVNFSKQDFLQLNPNPQTLEDGAPSSKDFSDCRNNRFHNPDSAQKTRFSPPTKVLHFFNAPPNITEDELKEVFPKENAKPPSRVRIFPTKQGARSSSGLIEFDGLSEATEAVILANHALISSSTSKAPYSLKLAFSASPILDKPNKD